MEELRRVDINANLNADYTRSNYMNLGYSKNELSEFVGYVINKTEEHIEMIKKQQSEIKKLKRELETFKKLEGNYYYVNEQAETNIATMKMLAKKEAETIIEEAKTNANKLINRALIEANNLESKNIALQNSIKIYKNKIKSVIENQLEEIENIEVL